MTKRKLPGKPMIETFTSCSKSRVSAGATCNGTRVDLSVDDTEEVVEVQLSGPNNRGQTLRFESGDEFAALMAAVEKLVAVVAVWRVTN